MHFFISFPLETDFFFCNFRIESRVQNRKQSDEAKQYSFNPSLVPGHYGHLTLRLRKEMLTGKRYELSREEYADVIGKS